MKISSMPAPSTSASEAGEVTKLALYRGHPGSGVPEPENAPNSPGMPHVPEKTSFPREVLERLPMAESAGLKRSSMSASRSGRISSDFSETNETLDPLDECSSR